MRLLRLLWISKRISGGLEVELYLRWPWEQLLVGYAGMDAEDVALKGTAVYRGALYLLVFSVELMKIHIPEEYWGAKKD